MLKKYMIFGSVVLLLAALLTMTGCSQATDSDGGSTAAYSENHLFGWADQEAVARAVESAKRTGRSVVISDGTWIRGNGLNDLPDVADFKDLPVRVEGDVTVGGGVIVNAALATLTFAEGATITVREGGAFIYQGSDAKIGTHDTNPGFKVRYVTDPLRGTQGTDRHVAISDYTIGTDFTNIAQHISHLYVLDKITVNAGSIATPGLDDSPNVIALGTVALEASNSLVFEHMLTHNFQFTDSAVLTSTVPSLTLTLSEDTIDLPTIEAAVPLTIQGTGAITSLEIAKIKGPDTLTITNGTAALNQLIIGEVSEDGKVAIGTGALGSTGVEITKNAGFISLNPGSIAGDIEAGDNTGTLTIAVDQINGTEVIVADNSGTINFDTPRITGTYTYNVPPTPSAYSGVYVKKNTGEVNFLRDLGVSVSYGIRAPVNNGTINFYGTLTVATTPATPVFNIDLGNGGSSPVDFSENIGGSGKVVFGGLARFGGNETGAPGSRNATNIDCDMVFNDGLRQDSGSALGLGGDVTLANGQSITIVDLNGATTSTTLKEGKKLLVGDVPVLIGGAAGATIAPDGTIAAANIVLTAGIPDPDDEDNLNYKTLFLTTGRIASITGNLRIAGTGLLRNAVPIATGAGGGSLTLEDGAILAAPTTGTSTVNFGGASITGLNGVEIDAIGGAVTLGPDSISGNGATLGTPEEAPVAGGPVITAGASLLIAGVNLDLQFYGSLNIPNATRVVLEGGTNPGKITLSEDTGTTFASGLSGNRINSGDTPATTYATLGGSGLLLGDELVVPCTIGEISGLPSGGRLTITGGSSGSTIVAGLSVVAP
jgi:hypothetical protein